MLAARYELQEWIGSGGFGTVYRARDRNLQRTVAIKLLNRDSADPDAVRRFGREAQVLARLQPGHKLQNEALALFEAIPAVTRRHVGTQRRVDVLQWWAATLAEVPDSTAARRLAPRDAQITMALAQLDADSGHYLAAASSFEAEALRTGDGTIAARAISILVGRGRCDEARAFVRDFVGKKIVDPANDAEPLPDLLAPCRAPVVR